MKQNERDMSGFFGFVLVGSGNISTTYLSAIGKVAGAEVVALVSRSGHRPQGIEDGVPVVTSLSEVTADYQGVILCTPNGTHCEGACEAAALGKHVLTEKVLEITRERMDKMIAACDAANVNLGVSYQRRMSPGNVATKRLLDDGSLGRIFAADMRVKFYRDMDYYNSATYRGGYSIDGGGPFIQQAAHNVDIFAWFFGLPDTVVSMLDTFRHDIEVEDHGVALMRYGNGMIGTITASTASKPGFAPVLEIHGVNGSLVLVNDEITGWNVDGVANPVVNTDYEVHDGSTSAAVTDTAGHEAIISDFITAARENRAPAVTASSAKLATDLILQIYESNVSR